MDIREFVKTSMMQVRTETLRSLEDTPEDAYHWYPGPEANPISFLLLHIGRTEDRFFHRWFDPSTPPLWAQMGLDKTYDLPLTDTPQEVGNSWTTQQVREFRYPPLDEMLRYLTAVREDSFRILDVLDLTTLEQPVRPDRPQMTRGFYLRQSVLHESSHGGVLDYLRGLYESKGSA